MDMLTETDIDREIARRIEEYEQVKIIPLTLEQLEKKVTDGHKKMSEVLSNLPSKNARY